jgi:hypothetical protein
MYDLLYLGSKRSTGLHPSTTRLNISWETRPMCLALNTPPLFTHWNCHFRFRILFKLGFKFNFPVPVRNHMIEGPATGLLPAKPWGCSHLFPVPEHRHISLDGRAETFPQRPRRSLVSYHLGGMNDVGSRQLNSGGLGLSLCQVRLVRFMR